MEQKGNNDLHLQAGDKRKYESSTSCFLEEHNCPGKANLDLAISQAKMAIELGSSFSLLYERRTLS